MKPIVEYSSGLASVCNSHDKVPWAKSKALLGSLTGLVRSRVNELQNPQKSPWRLIGGRLVLTILTSVSDFNVTGSHLRYSNGVSRPRAASS